MGWLSKIGKELKRAVDDVVEVVEDAFKSVGEILGIRQEEQDYSTSTGVLLNKTAATSNIPIIYGTRRSGGIRVFLHTAGSSNAYLYSVVILCEGNVSAVREIEINDDTIETWGGSSSYTLADGVRISLTSDVSACAHLGEWNQAADSFFVSELSEEELWSTDHRLAGLAYLSFRYKYNSEKINSLPSVTAVVDGCVLYDPRTDEEAFSSNAALVILDYMRSSVYGETISDEEINFDSFVVAAGIADRTLETYDESGEYYKPIDINGVIDSGESRLDNIKTLLTHTHASLPYSGGQYHLKIRSETAPEFIFNDDNIVGDISIGSTGASDRYNRVTVTFTDPELNWQENTVVYPTDDDEYQLLLSEDNNIEQHAEVTANMITNQYQALDYARRYLYESRKSLAIGFSALPTARSVLPGSIVEVQTAQLDGFLFSVEKRILTADGEYRLTLKEYDPTLYNWINTADLSKGATPSVASPYNLPAPTNLVFSAVEYNTDYQGVLSWDLSESAYVTRYKVNIFNTVTGLLAWSNEVSESNVQIPNLPAGNYRADVKGVSEISATATVSVSWTYSAPVLPVVTGLIQVGEFDADLSLSWNAVSEKKALRVYQVELLVDDLVIFSTTSATESITITNSQFKVVGYPRDFDVNVSAVNVALSNGPTATLNIQKPAPLPPLSVAFSTSTTSVVTRLVHSTNTKGVTAWLSTEQPVEENDDNLVYSGDLVRFEIGDLSPLTTHYLRVVAYDSFGFGSSATHSFTTLKDAVADSIQQLTERDLSLSNSLESISEDLFNVTITANSISQLIDDQNATISQQITSIYKAEIASETLAEEALLNAAEVASAKREQTSQSDTIALARSETQAVADDLQAEASRIDLLFVQHNEGNQAAIQQEATARTTADESLAQMIDIVQSKSNDNEAAIQQETTARTTVDSSLAQSIQSLSSTVGENKAAVDEYKRTAIGYCIDENGNPTSHETATSCELAGNTWQGESSIAEALRNVKVTGINANGDDVEVSAGAMYQAILDSAGIATATAAVLAIYGNQLAGIFANAGENGSSLEFIANQMKFKTNNGTKTPFYIEGDNVYLTQATIKDLLINKLKSDDGTVAFENGKLKADFIDADNLVLEYGNISNLVIKSADIQDGAINSAKIGSVIQSENYVPGSSGWCIEKNGSAEFNGAVISREMVIGTGVFDIGTLSGGNHSSLTLVYDEIIDTGVAGVSWSGTKYYTAVDAGFTDTSVTANETTASNAQWAVTCELVPVTRWSTAATMFIRIRIYAKRVVTFGICHVSWRLLRVT